MGSLFPSTDVELLRHLRCHGVQPTLQRLAIADVLLRRPCHMTADQVLLAARERQPELARATVYATLQLFVRQQLLRELPVDGVCTVYDSNLAPHHHLYNVDTGEVQDLPPEALQVLGLPALDPALQVEGMDVIVRVRARPSVSVAAPPSA
jgi:Fur family transcriptional regulator, iron response regulator